MNDKILDGTNFTRPAPAYSREKKVARLNCRITPSFKATLEKLITETGFSESDIIEIAILELLDNPKSIYRLGEYPFASKVKADSK